LLGCLCACLIFGYFLFLSSPSRFPVGRLVTIESGWSVSEAADALKELKVVRSPLAFKAMATLASDGNVIAGDYFFSNRRNLLAVVSRIARGEYGLEPTKVRVVEGATANEIAETITEEFPQFDKEEFLRLSMYKEGYLFPDTYYFLPSIKPESVVKAMEDNFYTKLSKLEKDLNEFDKPLEDVVVLASLLEKEAHDLKTRQMISGILWKRLEIDMPLQVDAVFLYINGKNTYELSLEDLRRNDSPYNTYRYKGLPPGPIGSPSLESILAALNPIPSDYLYYLADRAGNTYYARTFDEHKINKDRYIY
jgi:UPF0755 protein